MITASMSAGDAGPQLRTQRQADWELDFYSRPILENKEPLLYCGDFPIKNQTLRS